MKNSGWMKVAAGVLVVGSASAGLWYKWFRDVPEVADTSAEEPAADEVLTDVLDLPKEKVAAAELQFASATSTELIHEHVVPGRLQYDDRQHIVLRSATNGIITRLLVKPGQIVQAGDTVVELNSPEVGNARADALQRQSELKLAVETRDWEKATCDGLTKLSEAIRRRDAVSKIRRDFEGVTLGKSRETLLSAYSDLLLAETQLAAAEENQRNGVISTRTLEERSSNRDQFEAVLTASLEEQAFLASQSCRKAEASVKDAERRLRISLQNVRTLLGSTAGTVTAISTDSANAEAEMADDQLSLVQLKAPFAGTIERCNFSNSERVEAGEPLLTLANTTSLWVSADLRQREWRALQLQPGDKIRVMTTLEGIESREAVVHFAGREVDVATNAVPLVAVIENPDGRLRPGMFVRVAIPVSDPRKSLAVPESAILEHDQKSFVFTPENDHTFRRIDVEPGLRTNGFVEILSGLKDGDQVVASGGFLLKSEMLLQGESE